MAKKILLLMCSVLIMLLFLEMTSRFTMPRYRLSNYLRFVDYEGNPSAFFRASEITGYELIPNSSQEVNSIGMHDKEYAIKKKKNVYRILVLGDSITYPNLYPSILENKLNQIKLNGLEFEVLNAGLPGIGVRQYANYLVKKGINFSPDLVLIGFCINDFEVWSPIVYKNKNRLLEYFNPLPRLSRHFMNTFLFQHSCLYRFVVIRFENALYAEYRKTEGSLNDRKDEGLYYAKLIRDFCREKRIALSCVIFPYLKPLDTYDDFEAQEYRNMKEVFSGLSIDCLDLQPYFLGFDLHRLRESPNDFVHPNAAGHRIAGEAICNYLIKKYFKN